MLAAGGVLALMLFGVAMSGLIGVENDDPDEQDDPDNPEDEWAEAEDQATRNGTTLADLLFGGSDDDMIDAGDGDDTAFGGGGNDRLWGGAGHDLLDGEAGADSLIGGDGDDHLILHHQDMGLGGDGADAFEIAATGPVAEVADLPRIGDFEPGLDRLILDFDGAPEDAPRISLDAEHQPGSTLVLANDLPVALLDGVEGLSVADIDVQMHPVGDEGYTGADLMEGGTERDMLEGRARMHGQLDTAGQDAITGDAGEDALSGTTQGDAIFGNEGADTLSGQGGADELYGDAGDDSLTGGDGTDFLSGGSGDDTLSGGTGNDLLFGQDGDDSLSGGADDDYLQGGFGADTLLGGDGDDRLDGTFSSGTGGFGPEDQDSGDLLSGGDGDDTILIGAGDEALGGDGADTFASGPYIELAEVAGHVQDFDPSQDVIEVLYDPDLTPDPDITIEDFLDGTGANVLLDGQIILRVSGAQGLDPATVELRAIDLEPAAQASP